MDGESSQFTVSEKSQYRLRVVQILAALICSSLVFVFWNSGEKKETTKLPIQTA